MSEENATQPDLLYFGAEWCGPCQQMKPTIEELSEEYNIAKFDVEERQDLANDYHVRSLPTFISESGEDVDRVTGSVTKETLIELAES